MNAGAALTILFVISAVVGILGWLGFAPNGPRLVASIKERFAAPRKRQEELERRQAETAEQLQALQARVADLEVMAGRTAQGLLFDRSPEAQRLRQRQKDHTKGLAKPTGSDAPVGR
jgi:hypothetical protein